jgi:hypothetical protein
MKDNSRFSLQELVLTIAALIITTIVISNWLQSRQSAQESAAAAQLGRTNTRSFRRVSFSEQLTDTRVSDSTPSNSIATTLDPNYAPHAYPTSTGNGR